MSELAHPDDRTELPTERRMGQLRREGSMHLSNDVVQLASLTAGFVIVTLMVGSIVEGMKQVLRSSFAEISSQEQLSGEMLQRLFLGTLRITAPDLLIICLVIGTVSSLAVMVQTDWNMREKLIKFRWNYLDPIGGIKRIFSVHGVANTLKALAKLALILPIAYSALKAFAPEMISLIHLNIPQVMHFTGDHIGALFWKIFYVLAVLAVIDYAWTKFQWFRTNKMTKEEVKDEHKAVEGDETTKKKIQAKGFQRMLQRLKAAVPQADVVVTNPTHYAIALKYDRNKMNAPTVVAKGADFLALRIRELARESGVPILERKMLARALYESTAVGAEIPRALFKAVAEVLAYVYRLRSPHGLNKQQPGAGR